MTGPVASCDCLKAAHQHGDLNMYIKHGCRCLRCAVTRSQYSATYRQGRLWSAYDWRSAVGVARRLQALTAIGHTDRALATRLGIGPGHIIRLRTHQVGKVTPATFDAVARIYDELWDKPYDGPYSSRTRRLAARKGWLPPLAWDDDSIDDPDATPAHTPAAARPVLDEIAVERLMHGTLHAAPNCNATLELLEAVRRLVQHGLTDNEIGERVGLSGDAVGACRRRHSIPPASRTLAEAS